MRGLGRKWMSKNGCWFVAEPSQSQPTRNTNEIMGSVGLWQRLKFHILKQEWMRKNKVKKPLKKRWR